jgi:glyoxylase-like metal-dependent hydrolase (beta-lactamase superfamily II)
MNTHEVQVLRVATFEAPGPEVFWMSQWDEWIPLAVNVVLIRSGDVTALVNTGPPADITDLNAMWRIAVGPRCQLDAPVESSVENQLRAAGVTPDEVTHVILTPFQLYTMGGVHLFKNAQICLSKKGWVHFHTTHSHPHDSRWHSIPQDLLVHLVTDDWDRVRLLEDEDEVAPGIRTWWTGNHHRASIAVEIDTAAGIVVASDAFFVYENVEDNRPLGISENMYEGLAAFARARGVADHLIPLYDPRVVDRYPNGTIG